MSVAWRGPAAACLSTGLSTGLAPACLLACLLVRLLPPLGHGWTTWSSAGWTVAAAAQHSGVEVLHCIWRLGWPHVTVACPLPTPCRMPILAITMWGDGLSCVMGGE